MSLPGARSRAAHRIHTAEAKLAPAAAAAAGGISPHSLALVAARVGRTAPNVNLVLPDAELARGYAGVGTAWSFAADLAHALDMPLRAVSINPGVGGETRASDERFRGVSVTRVSRSDIPTVAFGDADIWVATHWTTAHALSVATQYGDIARARSVYLVQDYEPGFSAWSTDYVVAEATYRAGFLTVVNSTPVAAHLAQASGVAVDDALVFAPQLDIDALRAVADDRTPSSPMRVAFYGRPTKPRNLYGLGVAALTLTARRLAGENDEVDFVSVGEPSRPIALSRSARLRSLGRLTLSQYYGFLSSAQVVLSLQYSPHPSHPPLDAAISGAIAVTNTFGHHREGLHPRLVTADPTPEALSDALHGAILTVRSGYDNGFAELESGALGLPMGDVVSAVSTRLSRA